eukprot:533345-Hanusia_phi.AAC.1
MPDTGEPMETPRVREQEATMRRDRTWRTLELLDEVVKLDAARVTRTLLYSSGRYRHAEMETVKEGTLGQDED